MQQSPFLLREKLIAAVDERYHVKDMAAVTEVLGALETLPITKELLETTRLGKTVNEFRKRINNEKLAKRAKALVKKWRDAVLLEPALNGSSVTPGLGRSPTPSTLTVLRIATGFSSTSSSPKLLTASKVSPSASQNSNSQSPRILTNYNNNSRNGDKSDLELNQRIVSAVPGNLQHPIALSPVLRSPSLRVSSPANKTKSPFGPSSVSTLHSQNSRSPLSSSYAPNSESVSKTNAANKRLRIEDAVDSNSGPPSKKARTINGTGVEGSLVDPSVLDELSKDSIISRVSDNSDGSSSKPVSNISSGAVLSAAPSPLTINQDSNFSPPSSVGIGADTSTALISHEDEISRISVTETENSVVISGAEEPPAAVATVEPPKRGRKRKKKEIMDSESLLRIQIEKAEAIRTIERLSRDDDQSRSPDMSSSNNMRNLHIAALSRDEPVIKNEIVEKYLQSQNELRAQMERHYHDAVKRNEIPVEVPQEEAGPGPEETKKPKKKKDKKKDKKEISVDKAVYFASESEILSRLPPLDPEILAEFQNFEFYESEPEQTPKEPKSENETENNNTSLSLSNQQSIITNTLIGGTKIDWGDSDEDEDDFVEVPTKVESSSSKEDEVDSSCNKNSGGVSPMTEVAQTPILLDCNTSNDRSPKREVEEYEVERLHSEQLDNLNGNRDKFGDFKEWHETLTVESIKGDLLHILPYTIIDF